MEIFIIKMETPCILCVRARSFFNLCALVCVASSVWVAFPPYSRIHVTFHMQCEVV